MYKIFFFVFYHIWSKKVFFEKNLEKNLSCCISLSITAQRHFVQTNMFSNEGRSLSCVTHGLSFCPINFRNIRLGLVGFGQHKDALWKFFTILWYDKFTWMEFFLLQEISSYSNFILGIGNLLHGCNVRIFYKHSSFW